jgi:hypothetical protein
MRDSCTGTNFTILPPGHRPAIQGIGQTCLMILITTPWMMSDNIPDTSYEIQSNKTSRKALDKVPTAVQLLLRNHQYVKDR